MKAAWLPSHALDGCAVFAPELVHQKPSAWVPGDIRKRSLTSLSQRTMNFRSISGTFHQISPWRVKEQEEAAQQSRGGQRRRIVPPLVKLSSHSSLSKWFFIWCLLRLRECWSRLLRVNSGTRGNTLNIPFQKAVWSHLRCRSSRT